jgi:calcineurin-like phosphoesterase family protein
MRAYGIVRSGFVASILIAAGSQAAWAKSAKLEAAYVVLGKDGPVARAVLKGTTDCPAITLNTGTQAMSVRALPGTGKKAPFPVLVCELLLPSGTTTASLDGQALPLPPATLSTLAVIGDTGCRLKADKKATAAHTDDQDDGKFQDCDKKSKWPFSALAASVAAAKPQLLIHVGDYIYRESPCPKHDKGCAGSPHGDKWATWKADFFKPATPLLTATPWIATRGNHESCSRAGAGFMLFLDPTLAQNSTPPACAPILDPFTVTVGSQSFVVLDSADAPDDCPKKGCDSVAITAQYAAQFAAMTPAAGTWLVTHRPVWGIKNKGVTLNGTLQAALSPWQGKLPLGFALAIAGHIHLWEALSFADQRTPQLVLGNGGTLLAHKIKQPLAGTAIGGTTVASGISKHDWGFTTFTPVADSPNWTATFYSTKGNAKFNCTVAPTGVTC